MMKMVVTGSAGVLMLSRLLIYFVKSSPQVEKEEQLEIASCKYGPWRQEGKCSVSCGDGVMKMFRLPENTSEKECTSLESTLHCNEGQCAKHCEGQWTEWGPCAANCTKKRYYQVLSKEHSAGNPCSVARGASDVAQCTDGSCSIDCSVGEWTSKGECTRPCGGGKQSYTRKVLVTPLGRGKSCPALDKKEDCNSHECQSPKILRKLRDTLNNFSKGDPVMDVVSSEADGFKTLAKTSQDLSDSQGREWSQFVVDLRKLSADYNNGKQKLFQAFAKLLVLSKQAPDELEILVEELRSGDLVRAKRRFDRLIFKVSTIHEMIESVSKSFNVMEATARSYREKAIDQKEDFQETAAALNQRGISGPVSIHLGGFVEEVGIDHRGSDIACGRFASISELASQCFHDSSCFAFTLRDGKPWCLKHLRYDSGSVPDYTHVFYKKLVQSGGIVQTPDKTESKPFCSGGPLLPVSS